MEWTHVRLKRKTQNSQPFTSKQAAEQFIGAGDIGESQAVEDKDQ